MKYLIYLLPLPLILLSNACTPSTINNEAPAVNEIKVGEKFTIILPENHIENYIWKLSAMHDKTIIDHISSVWQGNEKGVYYNFVALKSGTDTLHLTQRKMQDSIKTVVYIVKVVD